MGLNTATPAIPGPAAARFDDELDAWVLTRYADVLAALRESRLTASGGALRREEHLKFRVDASASAAEMLKGVAALGESSRERARMLPRDRAADVVGELARPWSARTAMLVCPGGDAERMIALAGEVFAAAGEPLDATRQTRGAAATVELARAFSGELAAFQVQAFVALSQTLPCFLGNAWLALLNNSESVAMLRAEPELLPEAIEELLRHSGPARAQFRRAEEDVAIGEAAIAKGDRVVLMLAAANRDPEQFTAPDRLDFRRRPGQHVALGEGKHACIGAQLVRAAAGAATAEFIEQFAGAKVETVEWSGGWAIVGPTALWVAR